MDTTVKALQNLYTALGGDAAEVENIFTIAEMVNAIATQVTANAAEKSSDENP